MSNDVLLYVYAVKHAEKTKQGERTLDKSIRLRLESSAKNGHRVHLTRQIRLLQTIDFPKAVVQKRKTTAAILTHRGQKESGAIQRIQL